MSITRTRVTVGWLAAVALAAALLGAAPASRAAADDGAVAVIVHAGSAQESATAVLRHGGVVDRQLHIIGGVAARVPADAVDDVDAMPGVHVSPDEVVRMSAADLSGADSADVQLQALNPGPDWSHEAGSGVGVALIDTGVAETPDLQGRVIHGPDYSDEGDGVDRYGHGTFMAGLIAGDGSASTGPTRHYGVAPGAHIVSVKLAGRDGVTSLSKVLDAIGWAVVNADQYGIRVMNLSVGVPTKVAPQADPLSAAVEAAWASGITVVAAAGNEGAGVVTSPGRDPWVITVGSTDTHGTASTDDDTVPSWSGSGRVTRTQKPELLAPGQSVVSLRAPGSLVDEAFPQARVDDAYFRGSGTSMSAALVSGAAAVLADVRPWATPDDLKGALVSTGDPVAGSSAVAVDLAAADSATGDVAWRQQHPIVANGLGGHVRNGMPWAQASSPTPDETWSRVGWADGQWTRVGWARVGWARVGWARVGWADANFARVGWADANFTRVGWARVGWARVGWAGSNWEHDGSWSRVGWAASIWEGQPSP